MSTVTRMPLMILMVLVWMAMVQSECITNPMNEINEKAKAQYQITDEFLTEMEKSTPLKYKELLRLYGLYRACIESGTKRWTDNVGTGSGSCPYCRTKIEEEDKIMTRPKLPKAISGQSTSCKNDKLCHETQQGCFYYGVQGSEEECRRLGQWEDGRDGSRCVSDGNTVHNDWTCRSCRDDERVRTRYCPIMCGYCRPRCAFYCKNYGRMEWDSCKCKCLPIYTGKQCEVLDCSRRESDITYCSRFLTEDCKDELMRVVCPYLCGLCKN